MHRMGTLIVNIAVQQNVAQHEKDVLLNTNEYVKKLIISVHSF